MTSELILPPGIVLPPRLKVNAVSAAAATVAEEEVDKVDALPVPCGYKLLCVCPDVAETFENTNIVMSDAARRQEEHGTTVLFVLRVGPDAYKDEAKFPSGPWCKEGDFVVVRTYSGTRLKIFGKEFRVLNDDGIEAVVADPRGVGRA